MKLKISKRDIFDRHLPHICIDQVENGRSTLLTGGEKQVKEVKKEKTSPYRLETAGVSYSIYYVSEKVSPRSLRRLFVRPLLSRSMSEIVEDLMCDDSEPSANLRCTGPDSRLSRSSRWRGSNALVS